MPIIGRKNDRFISDILDINKICEQPRNKSVKVSNNGRVKNMHLWSILALLMLCGPLLAAAGTVYKSVDADGRVSYSDIKPTAPELEVKEIVLSDKPKVDMEAEEARLARISETADRLRQARLEQKELDIREQEAQQSAAPPPPVIVEEKRVYYPYAWQRQHRPFPSSPHHKSREGDRDTRPLRRTDRERDSGPVIVPKSPLLQPGQ